MAKGHTFVYIFYSLGVICHVEKPFTEVKIDRHDCVTGLELDGSSVPYLLSQLLSFSQDKCV
jgi:hypothetical protein